LSAEHADLLVELGTEELPPKSLAKLSEAFKAGVIQGLADANLSHGPVAAFATPRRLALKVSALTLQAADEKVEKRGPAVKVAFDADGKPSKAGLAFAKSVGRDISELDRLETDKGAWLFHSSTVPGKTAEGCVADIIGTALSKLPVAKPMRWADRDHEFVRPVHWLVILLGNEVVPAQLLGQTAGRTSRGHRFHAPDTIELTSADDYPRLLSETGFVVADFSDRRAEIAAQITQAATQQEAEAVIDPSLLDEITALVEWPVVINGSFEAEYLELPEEVLIATLQGHQRFVPLRGKDGQLTTQFVAISNIDSPTPDVIRAGYERVVRPRLADAAFFFGTDREQSLHARRERLHSVLFQRKLGSLFDVSERLATLAALIAAELGRDQTHARRAGELSRCDLVTDMVGEFPELQGTMGAHYARHDGEVDDVANALEQQYWPRFAGDHLPDNTIGQCLALASKLDLLCGIFAIGQKPSGTRDPFGLRRAALGILRIAIECELDLDVRGLINATCQQLPVENQSTELVDEVYDYLLDRLPAYYREQGAAFTTEMLNAVTANRPVSPLDFHRRLQALAVFAGDEAAVSLAAANKRVANILRKAGAEPPAKADPKLLEEAAEQALYETLQSLRKQVEPALAKQAYGEAMSELAGTRVVIDQFFDAVMVMTDREDLRRNRLALLAEIRELYNGVAELSRLTAS
jgi:glycyl-tRNA synthetase beta chain